MKVFFDTSAFVKRYVNEVGSEKVTEICEQADELALSIICFPEMISTLNRLIREGKLQKTVYQQIKELIEADLKDIEICDLSQPVIACGIECLEKYTLRTLDAFHVACAINVKADIFVSSDKRQIEAAEKEGLKVVKIQGMA